MGYAQPPGERYSAIGGDPAYLRWLQYDYDGDGARHGFDGVVPAESPYVTGANLSIVPGHHGELVASNDALDLIIGALGYVSVVDLPGSANLAGTTSVRLEYADVVQDHDGGSTDEIRFDVYVDADGNNDTYAYVDTIAYDRDGPFTQDWGNSGPASAAVTLPGTSPRMDVKLVVWEDDCCGAREPVSTAYFTDVLLSDDLDGMDYYEDAAPDAKGGTNTFRVSVNGATSQVGETRLVGFGFDRALVEKTLESWGKAEAQFTLHAGRDGFAGEYYRGSPADGSHYSRSANSWADIGSHAKNDGVVEDEIVWQGRMLNSAIWRFDAEYFDDDGGWSSRDSGGRYEWTGAVSTLAPGRSDNSGTSLGAWDAYWYITVEG